VLRATVDRGEDRWDARADQQMSTGDGMPEEADKPLSGAPGGRSGGSVYVGAVLGADRTAGISRPRTNVIQRTFPWVAGVMRRSSDRHDTLM
jgi:hypothetical protein